MANKVPARQQPPTSPEARFKGKTPSVRTTKTGTNKNTLRNRSDKQSRD